jgi:hypothetical protein
VIVLKATVGRLERYAQAYGDSITNAIGTALRRRHERTPRPGGDSVSKADELREKAARFKEKSATRTEVARRECGAG